MEFGGNKFEEVLDIASQFKKWAPTGAAGAPDLDEHLAHQFLEKRGETLTVTKLRQYLKEIDVDNNHRMAFLEYALWKWQKKPSVFFKEFRALHGGSEELLRAIAEYREILDAKEKREKKMSELEAAVALGGVKGNAAKHQLEQMKSEDLLARNKAEITAAATKRKAEKNAVDPFEEEQKRVAREAEEKANAEKSKRDEGRGKLAAKASLWNNAAQ